MQAFFLALVLSLSVYTGKVYGHTFFPIWVLYTWVLAASLGMLWSEINNRYGDWLIAMLGTSIYILILDAITESGDVHPSKGFAYALLLLSLLFVSGYISDRFRQFFSVKKI